LPVHGLDGHRRHLRSRDRRPAKGQLGSEAGSFQTETIRF
jgi:hypothetical protein